MKFLKLVSKWIIIALVIQLIVLGLAEIYLTTGFDFGLQKFKISFDMNFLKKSQVNLPSGKAENIKVSFDASYIAYTSENGITIYSADENKIIKEISSGESEPAFYKWLPDRDILVFSFKTVTSVAISTFDAYNGIEHDYPPLTRIVEGSWAEDAALSVQTNVIYLKVQTAADSSAVYRYNIMDQLEYIFDVTPETVIVSMSSEDNLLYAAPYADSVLVIRNGVRYTYESAYFESPIALLGRDYDDVVYLAEKDGDGKISIIKSGTVNNILKGNFTDYELPSPAEPREIFMAVDESIYRVDAAAKIVFDIRSDMSTAYKGDFIDVTSDYVISFQSGAIRFTYKKK